MISKDELNEKEELENNSDNEEVLEETKENEETKDLSEILEEKDQKIIELEESLEKEKTESLEYLNTLKNVQSEFISYKKRMEREKIKAVEFANKELGFDLLQVIDNLERALSSESNKEAELYKGLDLVLKQFKDILKKYNIEEVNPIGEAFDMDFHEVVLKEDSKEDSNTVIEVLQKGYKINGKILRPAMVKVAN